MALTISASNGSTTATYYMRQKDGSVALVELQRDDINDAIDDGEKQVALVGYSDPFELTSEQYGTRNMIRLLFRVTDGEQKGEMFSCLYGVSLGQKAKLREVVTAILNRDLRPGEGVEFDELLMQRAIIGTKAEMNGKGYSVVRHVSARPVKRSAAPAAAAPAQKASADELWDEDITY